MPCPGKVEAWPKSQLVAKPIGNGCRSGLSPPVVVEPRTVLLVLNPGWLMPWFNQGVRQTNRRAPRLTCRAGVQAIPKRGLKFPAFGSYTRDPP